MCRPLRANASDRRDPTRTKTLRAKFQAEMGRRFRWLRGQIRAKIVEDDGFGLKANRGEFEFRRSSEKVGAFMEWLQRQQREGILGIQEGTPITRAADRAWTNTYIDSAYNAGVRQAAARMRSEGAEVAERWIDSAFNRPIHADRVGIAYTRTFNELQGITDAMDQQVSRELANGLAQGLNPRDIADTINGRVEAVGHKRAVTLARTEVINAHAEATLNSYEEAEIEGVQVVAEFVTAGDDRVCPTCEDLERRVADDGGWSLERARGVIPVHPNCRCVWAPMVGSAKGVELR